MAKMRAKSRHQVTSAVVDGRDLTVPVETLSAKGRQTREAIEQAARKLFAERGFHGTTLGDITSAAGKSPASFYRYFADKEDLLAVLAQSFLHEVVAPSGLSVHLPDSPEDDTFFRAVVTGYWNMFKQNIGIMVSGPATPGLPSRVVGFYHGVVAELKRVTWPDLPQVRSATIAIIIFVLFLGLVITLLDIVLRGVFIKLLPQLFAK